MDAIISIMGIIIPSAITLVGCMINNNMQRAKEQHAIEMKMAEINANYDKTTALIKAQIDELAKDVSKHNNIVERTYACEDRLNVLETKIAAYHEHD